MNSISLRKLSILITYSVALCLLLLYITIPKEYNHFMGWILSALLITTSLILCLLWIGSLRMASRDVKIFQALFWIMYAWLLTYFAESFGIHTSQLFGHYEYNHQKLLPSLYKVPLCVPFAWICITLSAGSITQRFLQTKQNASFTQILTPTIFGSGLVVLSVVFLHPATTLLEYRIWKNETSPSHHYASWGVISAMLLFLANRFELFSTATTKNVFSDLMLHVYIAHIVFCIGVIIFL